MLKQKVTTVLFIGLMLIGLLSCLTSVLAAPYWEVTLASDGFGLMTSRDVYDNNNIFATSTSLTVNLPNVKMQFQDVANTGYHFDHFIISGTNFSSNFYFTNPAVFIVSGSFTITAINVANGPAPTPSPGMGNVTVNIQPNLAGLGIFISDVTTGVNTPAITGTNQVNYFAIGDELSLTPFAANNSYEFQNYTITDGGSLNGVSTDPTYSFTLSENCTLTANFDYILTNGGHLCTIIVHGPGIIYYVSDISHNNDDGALQYNTTDLATDNTRYLPLSASITTETFTAQEWGIDSIGEPAIFDYWIISGDTSTTGQTTSNPISLSNTGDFTVEAYFHYAHTPNPSNPPIGFGAFDNYIWLFIGSIFTFLSLLIFMKAGSIWIVGTIMLIVGFVMMIYAFPSIYGLVAWAMECIICPVFLYSSSASNKRSK